MIKRILFILCLILFVCLPVNAGTFFGSGAFNAYYDAYTMSELKGLARMNQITNGTDFSMDFSTAQADSACQEQWGVNHHPSYQWGISQYADMTSAPTWGNAWYFAVENSAHNDVDPSQVPYGSGIHPNKQPSEYSTLNGWLQVQEPNVWNAKPLVMRAALCANSNYAVLGMWTNDTLTPPSTNRNITVHVKNLANEPLEGFYVEIMNSDISYANADLTDSNGYVIFPVVPIIDSNQSLNVHVISSGIYESYDEDFDITADTVVEAVMLSASPSGTYRNITYFIQSNTGTALSGIYLNHIVSPDFQLGDSSNSTGYIKFNNVPVVSDTAYYEVDESTNPSWHDSSGFFSFTGDMTKNITLMPTIYYPTPTPTLPPGQTATPTPTPTPIGQYALYLTAYPDSINLGSSVLLTGSASYQTALSYAGGLRRTSFYVNTHPTLYPFDYQMIGIYENVNATYWKFRPNNSVTWQTATTASPLTMTHTPISNGLITYAFNAYDTSGNAISTAGTDDVLVGGGAGSGALTIKIGAFDATTNSQLMNYVLNVTDEASGSTVEYGSITYDQEITLPRGNGYVARVTKTGYQTSTVIGESGTLLFIVPTNLNIQKGDFGAYFRVPLFPDGSVIAGNTTVSSRVYDLETYYPLSGVQVVNSYAPTDIKYTGTDAESVSWVIPQNTAYSLTASKTGYCSVTEARNTGTNAYQWIPLYLKYGSCAGATATPTPTPTITPTATPVGGWGNVTGGASVCGDMPANATIIDILKNSMACNGLEDTQSQNLGMSMLIILFAAIILGRIAKGVGVLAGAIIGTVISTVAGFLPFWIIIVVIIMAGLVFAGKVFWSNQQ
jgi:hypothetical protein